MTRIYSEELKRRNQKLSLRQAAEGFEKLVSPKYNGTGKNKASEKIG